MGERTKFPLAARVLQLPRHLIGIQIQSVLCLVCAGLQVSHALP
jgi:peptidoglycan biosynthesis protein MviN/MurJ (putative lipid II flippase)